MASLNIFGSPPGAGYPAEASVSIQWGTKLIQCCKDLDCIAYNPWRKNDKIMKILN